MKPEDDRSFQVLKKPKAAETRTGIAGVGMPAVELREAELISDP